MTASGIRNTGSDSVPGRNRSPGGRGEYSRVKVGRPAGEIEHGEKREEAQKGHAQDPRVETRLDYVRPVRAGGHEHERCDQAGDTASAGDADESIQPATNDDEARGGDGNERAARRKAEPTHQHGAEVVEERWKRSLGEILS